MLCICGGKSLGVVRASFILLLVTAVAHDCWREEQLESPVSSQETVFLSPSCGGYFLIGLCLPLSSFFLPVGPDESQEFSLVPTDGLWDSEGACPPFFLMNIMGFILFRLADNRLL